MDSRGFTLIELMMVVIVIGLVLTAGLPTFSRFRDGMVLVQARTQLMTDLRTARQVAVTRHCPVFVAFGNGSSTTDVTSYTIHYDTNGDGLVSSGEPRFLRTMPNGCKVNQVLVSPTDTVGFDMSGLLRPSYAGGRLVLRTTKGRSDSLYVSVAGMTYRP
jgi:prepilin-type N-terminal cleavage/methylation domain-containing protein